MTVAEIRIQNLRKSFAHFTAVRDSSRGIEWTTWFVGGRLNVANACVERWRVQGRMLRAAFQSLRGGGPMPWPDLRLANIGGVFFSSLNKTWGPRMMRRKVAGDDDDGIR